MKHIDVIDRKVYIYKQESERLSQLEKKLIELISETGDDELQNTFLDWINQRTRCNETYLSTLKIMSE